MSSHESRTKKEKLAPANIELESMHQQLVQTARDALTTACDELTTAERKLRDAKKKKDTCQATLKSRKSALSAYYEKHQKAPQMPAPSTEPKGFWAQRADDMSTGEWHKRMKF